MSRSNVRRVRTAVLGRCMEIRLNLGMYSAAMQRAIDGHIADMKIALRAIEDGSFLDRVNEKRPGAVIHVTTTSGEVSLEGAPQRLVRTCYRAMITELITFIDSVVAVRRILHAGFIAAPGPDVSGEAEILDYAQRVVAQSIADINRDRHFTNPTKIDEIGLASAAKPLKEFVVLRNCLEHHRGIPNKALKIHVKVMKVLSCGEVITALPFVTREAGEISIRMDEEVRTFPEGQPVSLTEADVEHVAVTLTLHALEIVQYVEAARQSGRFSR